MSDTLFHLGWVQHAWKANELRGTWWETSTYWQGQENIDAATVMTESQLLKTGLALVFAKAVARPKAIAQLRKEQELEAYRQQHYPARPSRRNCLFVCDTEAALHDYVTAHAFPLQNRTVVELSLEKISPPYPVRPSTILLSDQRWEELFEPRWHRALATHLNVNGSSDDIRSAAYERYWSGSGAATGAASVEVLVDGWFRVESIRAA